MVVTIKTNITRFRANNMKLIKKIDNANNVGIKELSTRFKLMAQTLAPKRSGKLINSIRDFKIAKGRRIIADAQHKGFPYPMWVNAEPGFETINAFGKIPAKYGVTPRNWNWTAVTLKFWDKTIEDTEQRFKPILTKVHKNMVRVIT